MPAPVELRGQPASRGIATGPIVRLRGVGGGRVVSGDPVVERQALASAIAAAIVQIERLIAGSDGESADILEFQTAMLADEELAAPALADVERGVSAERAWEAALAGQIASYESGDAYFRARTADLADIRDRVLRILSGADDGTYPPGAILLGDDVTPSRFLETDWSGGGGIALSAGSASSHVAMLARSRGVPMVVGIGTIEVDGHLDAVLDGERGTIVLSPDSRAFMVFEAQREALARAAAAAASFLHREALTADGSRVRVLVNVARPEEVDGIDVASCDGVGLMRTEFLFGGGLPDEETQFRAYARVLAWAEGRPVTIRTVDAGGDKPVPGFTVDEANPFLGLRGIRLSLRRTEIFRIQLRALARAAVSGNLKVMLPMVTVPEEITAASDLLDAAVAELAAGGTTAARPPLGIMVEVPAVAIVPELYAGAAFFSIGSNDLTQYVTAAARDSSHVAGLNDVRHPAVIELIRRVAVFGRDAGIEVSLCGEAAGDPALVPMLLQAGLRSLSVSPSMLASVKAAIAAADLRA